MSFRSIYCSHIQLKMLKFTELCGDLHLPPSCSWTKTYGLQTILLLLSFFLASLTVIMDVCTVCVWAVIYFDLFCVETEVQNRKYVWFRDGSLMQGLNLFDQKNHREAQCLIYIYSSRLQTTHVHGLSPLDCPPLYFLRRPICP